MELIINQPLDLSLNDLLEQQQAGHSVVRSPHIGNHRLYNLVLANAGIDMLLVDHNMLDVDKNYFPGMVVSDQTPQLLAEGRGLSMRTQITSPFDGRETFLDELHMASLTEAFPQTSFQTTTDFLRTNESVAAEITNICAEVAPELFKRFVPKDEVEPQRSRFQLGVTADRILQFQDDPRVDGGLLMPNELDILINFFVDFLNSGEITQYHISGPDMKLYMKTTGPEIARLAAIVASQCSFADQLPDQIRVELVDATPLTLAATKDKASKLQPLLEAIGQRAEIEKESASQKKAFFTGPNKGNREMREVLLAELQPAERAAFGELLRAAEQFPEFSAETAGLPESTQYDCLAQGGLFVPEMCKELTMAELIQLRKSIRRGLDQNKDTS